MNANDNLTPGEEWVLPPEEPEAAQDTAPRPPRRQTAAKLLALVAASVIVGAGASYVHDHRGTSTASAGTASAAGGGFGPAAPGDDSDGETT